jgi:hypothetical protein
MTVSPMMSHGFSVASRSAMVRSISPSTAIFMSDMSDEFPSDSSTEDIVDVEAESMMPTVSEGIVNSILDDLPYDGKPVTVVSKETRAKINEAVLKLEAMNPTENPASSKLLNGIWTLRYAGGYEDEWAMPSPTRQIALFLYSGGYSPGIFALSLASSLPASLIEVGELSICKFLLLKVPFARSFEMTLFLVVWKLVKLTSLFYPNAAISREQPRVEAKIDVKFLGGASNDVSVKAHLEPRSDVRLSETYESATVLGQNIDIPEALQYSRDLYIAYLDEDILIVRDGSGVPEILVRKK